MEQERQEITDNDRARIAINKEKALSLRKASIEMVKEDHRKCTMVLSSGSICNFSPVDAAYMEHYGEYFCKNCIIENDILHQITRQDAKSLYLLSDASINTLRCIIKENPRNKLFSSMKLYLKKHAVEKSIAKWGSESNLVQERKRREDATLQKLLENKTDFFKHALAEDDLIHKRKRETKGNSVKKMISSIRGNSTSTT